jgi:PAS domain S-box-containing protein
MIIVDPETGRIKDANDAAARFFLMSREALSGLEVSVLGGMPQQHFLEMIREIMDSGSGTGEQEALKADGTRVLVEWQAAPVEIEGATSLFIIAHDITEKKRVEAQRREMEARLVESQKLESLGILAGGIAHDFNNILQGVMGNADLALRSVDAQSPIFKRLDAIRATSRRAADLCKLMLAYSGRGSFNLERMDVASLVRETVQMVEASVSKQIAVECSLEEDLPPVVCDAAQVRQVVMNLLINAAEAIGDAEGTISLSASRAAHPDGAPASGGDETGVLLSVRDTGCGMGEATLARIFEPFYTTKFTGRGLGLAAVQGIVRSHRGHLAVKSVPGSGSEFRIFFPAVGEGAEVPRSSSAVRDAAPMRGTVLLVDDEEEVREVGRGMLEHLGYRVETASGGREALAMLEGGGTYDAVILDLTMPGLDGTETLRRILAKAPALPVVLVSGYDAGELETKFAKRGFAGFLHKPFSLDGLASALGAVLRRSGAGNEPVGDGGAPERGRDRTP